MESKKLCFCLINAQTELEVDEIIKGNVLLNDGRNWAPYGNLENNVGTFITQQSNPVAAITEKIINSIDAVLLAECKKRSIDPESAKAPRSMQDAVEKFFDIKDGDFSEVANKRKREISNRIQLIAEGDKKRPNIIIVDTGEGQNPKDFEDTFLSLHKRNKIKVPFVQGKYNMGGTGVLPFCGKHHYQLIVSRKSPNFLKASQRDFWGYTLVRYREGQGFDRSGIFEYCTDRGDILKFDGEPLKILPEESVLEYGTFIKLYEYRLNKPSSILRDLYKDLNRSLYNPAIPFLIYEARESFDIQHGRSTYILGNKWRTKIDSRDNVEEFLPIEAVLGEFGMCNIEVVVFKEDAPKENITTQNEAIFFTVNGQTHATLGRSFLRSSSKVGLDYLGDSLAIFIELSNISSFVRDHAFMGSRDRMRDDEIKKEVEEDLAEVLRNHKGLKRLNQQRREKAITKNPKDENFLKKILQKLVRSNNSIAEILGLGTDVPFTRVGHITEERFEGKRFPTFLKIYKYNPEKTYFKEIPVNSFGILKLETDAENAYLSREHEKGELIVSPNEVRKSSYLYNGIITIKLVPKKEWKIGEKYNVKVFLTRSFQEQLTVEFDILVTPEIKPQTSTPDTHSKKTSALNLPTPILVYRNGDQTVVHKTWKDMNPEWTSEDIVDVKSNINDNSTRQFDVFINMDSNDLIGFLQRKKLSQVEQDSIKRLYQTAILLYSLVIYNDLTKQNNGSEELLPVLMKSISKICLDLAYSETLIKEVDVYD